MAPNLHAYMMNNMTEPVSRTYQYRKVMKPMLERKRRARINRCLDELKELMTSALQTEGENVAKLEKADILELTVRHLHTLRNQNQLNTRPESSYADRFRAGFRHCAVEVTSFLNGLDQPTKHHLSSYLSHCIRRLEGGQAYSTSPTGAAQEAQGFPMNAAAGVPAAVSVARQQPVFPSHVAEEHHRRMAVDRSPSPSDGPVSPSGSATSGDENVWRPW